LNLVASAIQNYKTKKGYYPPDDDPQYLPNQLYYELSGTTSTDATVYTTLDGAGVLDLRQVNPIYYGTRFKTQGILNSTKGQGGDEGRAAQKFIQDLKPGQVAEMNEKPPVKILVASVGWDGPTPLLQPFPTGPAKPGQLKLNPIRYVSTGPTNNPNSFDLWVDIVIAGKTNRICNWSEDPIVLP
jgi:hypothetical protein